MTRGRLCIVCALRLAVYFAAMFSVRHAAGPSAAARFVISVEASAHDLGEPLVAVLLFGILMEVLNGAARWR
jgi:hypothetical protein